MTIVDLMDMLRAYRLTHRREKRRFYLISEEFKVKDLRIGIYMKYTTCIEDGDIRLTIKQKTGKKNLIRFFNILFFGFNQMTFESGFIEKGIVDEQYKEHFENDADGITLSEWERIRSILITDIPEEILPDNLKRVIREMKAK